MGQGTGIISIGTVCNRITFSVGKEKTKQQWRAEQDYNRTKN